MKKKIIKILIGILSLAILILGVVCIIDHIRMNNNEPVLFSTWGKKYREPLKTSKGTNVVLTLHDEITEDTAWCGTFQLIWNDLKNDLAKQDIVFTPQLEVVENLNKGTFTTNEISEDSYYKVYGNTSIELKEQIEKAIKEKFDETSDILDAFEWENSEPNDYFLYSMLKKEFEFEKKFTELEKGTFGEYNNVEYFGIKEDTNKSVKKQVEVLYYNSSDEFAIKLITKQNDEVIIAKGTSENNFYDIYQNILDKGKKYEGRKSLNLLDTVKIPNIQFKVEKEFEELENNPFKFFNNKEYIIEKAVQTIEFELDKSGGRIKSEAGMNVAEMSEAPIGEEIRKFLVDDSFTIFLQEEGKLLPYFAAKIDDISKFQTNNTKLEKNEEAEKSDKTIEMYKTIIDNLMTNSNAIYSGDKYISLDVKSLKAPAQKGDEYVALTEQEQNELLEYCKKYHEEVKKLSIEELKEQGFNKGDETFISLEGALLGVIEIEKLTEDKAVIWFQSFHTGLGAIMQKYELKYKNGEWKIKALEMAIS